MSTDQGFDQTSTGDDERKPGASSTSRSESSTSNQEVRQEASPAKEGSSPQTTPMDTSQSELEGEGEPPSSPAVTAAEATRQVIAVSASKGPAAFFNLARKFLATDEMCDLSALEGAIVSAVDAAHLLERSQLATIVRVSTSYVTVEPKRKRQASATTEPEDDSTQQQSQSTTPAATLKAPPTPAASNPKPPPKQSPSTPELVSTQPGNQPSSSRQRSSGRELRRARIVITVQRTESYKQWLQENPLQAIIAGDTETVLEQPADSVKQNE